jgi:hypothetical protein
MSHSDEVSGAVVGMSAQVAQKGVETAQHLVDKTVDNIAKLLQALFNKDGYKPQKDKDVTASDMTDIKSGEVGIKELVADAKKNGDSVVSTDGYSKADMKFIAVKANEYGIPVAFTSKKNADNICAHVRGCDKPMFERICTDLMQSKIKTKPDTLDNFKAERWEIDGIGRELSKHDLNANWGKTKDGEYFCLFDKADKKAILMARAEFVRKCDEVENGLIITQGEEYGAFSFEDAKTGNVITINDIPTKNELSALLQEKFGYDENKANIACCKFGERYLYNADQSDVKREFFAEKPQNEFSKIENHIKIKDENILASDYTCLRLTPKASEVPCVVFRDESNNFAVLNPEKMTRKQMSEVILESLEITDDKTVAALVEKAEKVNDYYVKQNNDNFVLVGSETIGDVKDDKSVEYQCDIERHGKDKFKVETKSHSREFAGLNVEESKAALNDEKANTASLVLSFSDKKNALSELTAMFKSQGLSDETAKQSAKSVFSKAQAQSAEKVLQIEEIKVSKQTAETHGNDTSVEAVATVRYGGRAEEIELSEREQALADLVDKFGVTEEEAELLLTQADDKISDDVKVSEKSKKSDKPLNGHEKKPVEKVEADVKPDVDVPEAPKAPAPRRK